ncbi:MAG: 5'-nucleotidase C-terminal domain-containing protein, partial [Spirochaetaceae bacterium]|nr:5'-nucleotidase C-terminal domain-containing protein [Spirochaetaceae bacterium]
TVRMDYDEKTGVWKASLTGGIVDGADLPVDAEFVSRFSGAKTEVMEYVNKPIGRFTKSISTRDSMFKDSAFVDLIHEIQLELTDADVSFAAPLSLDAQINEGDIYVRDMFNLYKYENLLYTMELTGGQIDDFLEYSYGNWMDTMTGPQDQLIRFKKDDSGNLVFNERYNSYDTVTRYYNYDSAAGIDYVVDVSAPEGDKVEILRFSDGAPFSESAAYEVAINSYRASGGGGHLTRGAGLDKEDIESATLGSTDKDLRYYLMKWIENERVVTPAADDNWRVEPAEWASAGAAASYPMLYGE